MRRTHRTPHAVYPAPLVCKWVYSYLLPLSAWAKRGSASADSASFLPFTDIIYHVFVKSNYLQKNTLQHETLPQRSTPQDIPIVWRLTSGSSLPGQDCCHTFENFLSDTHASLYTKPTSPISILHTQQHNQRLRCRFNRNEFVHHHKYIHSLRKAV